MSLIHKIDTVKNIGLIGLDQLNVNACVERGLNVRWAIILPNTKLPSFDFNFDNLNYNLFQNFAFEVTEGSPFADEVWNKIWDEGFEVFRRHYFRMMFPKYSEIRQWNDVNNLFHMYAQFFHKKLVENRITTLFFMNIPHEGPLYVLYVVARNLNIETYVTKPGPHPCTLWISDGLEDFGTFETVVGGGHSYPLIEKPETPFYMKWKDVEKNKIFVRKKYLKELSKYFIKFILGSIIWNRKALIRSFERLISIYDQYTIIASNESDPIQELDAETYVYFALHRQPECSADTQGHEFGDQLYAIERLRFLLPQKIKIIVKENPKQVRHARPDSFYARLSLLENVSYIKTDTPTFTLIENSLFVATLAGTVGFESLVMQKSVMIFGDAWYCSLPGCFRYTPDFDIRKITSFKHDREHLAMKYEKLTQKLYPGIVEELFSGIEKPNPYEYCEMNADTISKIIGKTEGY